VLPIVHAAAAMTKALNASSVMSAFAIDH
jgi:hypothetical protein